MKIWYHINSNSLINENCLNQNTWKYKRLCKWLFHMVVSSLFPCHNGNKVETTIDNGCFIQCVYTLRHAFPGLTWLVGFGPFNLVSQVVHWGKEFFNRALRFILHSIFSFLVCSKRVWHGLRKSPRYSPKSNQHISQSSRLKAAIVCLFVIMVKSKINI